MGETERLLRNLINVANMHREADNCNERCTVSLMDLKAVAEILVIHEAGTLRHERERMQNLINQQNWS